jgi:hypothetical protein
LSFFDQPFDHSFYIWEWKTAKKEGMTIWANWPLIDHSFFGRALTTLDFI